MPCTDGIRGVAGGAGMLYMGGGAGGAEATGCCGGDENIKVYSPGACCTGGFAGLTGCGGAASVGTPELNIRVYSPGPDDGDGAGLTVGGAPLTGMAGGCGNGGAAGAEGDPNICVKAPASL